ncbi:phBC6A51 family helix-turn-helix protein [Paenibacillus sp. 453mf]|uniref:phBC6A51 family helix-turn-helix protein n=1 Tax=Paenibacillus sp. 453mf TaxID=1761874 RepID=UPI00147F19F4|nr:phBC6A51 family helix-turn-helix protein [Paenibacillus sp. 453mf]
MRNWTAWLTVGKRKKRNRPPLDERHRLAIRLIARKSLRTSYEAIALECGVSRRQLYRWLDRKDFRRELRKETEKVKTEVRRSTPRINLDGCSADVLRRYFEVAGVLARESD